MVQSQVSPIPRLVDRPRPDLTVPFVTRAGTQTIAAIWTTQEGTQEQVDQHTLIQDGKEAQKHSKVSIQTWLSVVTS